MHRLLGLRSRLMAIVLVSCLVIAICQFRGQAEERAKVNPETEIKITNIERLNTEDDEDCPALAPTNLAMYFVRKREGKPSEIMVAVRRSVTQPFLEARPIEELNGSSDRSNPFPMPREADGSEYIFFSMKGEANNLDVYFTRRLRPTEAYQWIAKAPVHQICTEEDEADPWVSPDSREMYFSRRTKEGWRLVHARGTAPRSFEKVQVLEFPVGFRHPWPSRDGLTLYLQGPAGEEQPSDGAKETRWGLYVAKRPTRTAPWGMPKPITVLNHSEGKIGTCSPSLSTDGRFLYFASDRPGGKGGLDLYYVLVNDLKQAGF
ncbi:MAG: hypothetical protein NZM31_06770 [Gemmatales bacterium]|nr:hypothetical protein [Gemmatales bacterium]MDW8386703.1 hypothetical protein [Gemmatales bacterium]